MPLSADTPAPVRTTTCFASLSLSTNDLGFWITMLGLTQGFLRAYAEVGECSGTKSTLTGKGHVATASMNPLLHSFDVFDRCVTTFEQNLWLARVFQP
jgi:hypothetical protein